VGAVWPWTHLGREIKKLLLSKDDKNLVGNFVFFAFLNNDDRVSIRAGDISMREPTGIFVGGDVFFSLFMPLSPFHEIFLLFNHIRVRQRSVQQAIWPPVAWKPGTTDADSCQYCGRQDWAVGFQQILKAGVL
jgi:hypothetical protein